MKYRLIEPYLSVKIPSVIKFSLNVLTQSKFRLKAHLHDRKKRMRFRINLGHWPVR